MWIKICSLNDDTVLGIIGYKAMRTLIKPGLGLLNFTENSVMLNGLLGCKHHSCMRPERSRNQEWTSRWYSHLSHTSACLSLSASADYHRHSCLGCIGSCGGLCYRHSLSLFIWPVLSLVLASSPHSACWRLLRGRGLMGAGWDRAGTSCSPGDGCTVFLGLHTQRSYAGGLSIWINIEIIAIDSPTDPSTPKQTAHMSLSHVAASWTWYTQEVRDASRTVRVRGHAGGHRVTRHDTTGHRRCPAAAPYPWRVLDLEKKRRRYFHNNCCFKWTHEKY